MKLRKSVTNLAALATVICLVAAAPASAQCIPAVFPANWLALQDAAGGHTVARHVGRTNVQLIARLWNEPNIPAASTYTNLPTAHGAITAALGANAGVINAWAAGAAPGATRVDNFVPGMGVLGRIAHRPPAPANIVNSAQFRTIIRATGGGNCFLLTSFPT